MRRLESWTRPWKWKSNPGQLQDALRAVRKQKPGTFRDAVLLFDAEVRKQRRHKAPSAPRRAARPFWWHPAECECRKCDRAARVQGATGE